MTSTEQTTKPGDGADRHGRTLLPGHRGRRARVAPRDHHLGPDPRARGLAVGPAGCARRPQDERGDPLEDGHPIELKPGHGFGRKFKFKRGSRG